ncbi:MAG: DUF192 domain-containing protein [Rhodovibrionaceae bacterium]|nr:DUF192 domain-containing protein [Rhodovibrionaceae bacterium]
MTGQLFTRLRSAALAFAVLLAPACLSAAEPFETDTLVIETADGESHRFEVELAVTAAQQGQGLMYRQSMDENAGMLFVERRERRWRMWMENTYIPLDMLFIDSGGRILRIVERTVPLSREIIASGQPAKAVLELNAGTANRLDIQVGDIVRHEAFQNAKDE